MLVMLKIGATTYGGGWSILAQFQAEFIDKRGWLTEEELMDYVSVGRSLPGIVVFNYSTLIGYRVCGFWGAYLAPFCIALPAVFTLAVVVIFYENVRDSGLVARILVGVRAAVVPTIAVASLKLRKGALAEPLGYVLVAASFLICVFTEIEMGALVISGALIGLLRYILTRRNNDVSAD